MSENGNKGGSWLMAAVLSVLIAALAIWTLMLAEWREPVQKAYIDPELSQSLVRGSIVDRNGDYLALQAPVFGFFIHLSDASAGEAASSISAYTSENAISIEEKIENGAQFIPLGRILSSDEIIEAEERIRELGLLDDIEPGSIEMRLEPSPASHAIVSGMERLYDDALSPRPTPSDPIAEGSTIRLSIDMDLQKALEETSPSTAAIISFSWRCGGRNTIPGRSPLVRATTNIAMNSAAAPGWRRLCGRRGNAARKSVSICAAARPGTTVKSLRTNRLPSIRLPKQGRMTGDRSTRVRTLTPGRICSRRNTGGLRRNCRLTDFIWILPPRCCSVRIPATRTPRT